MDLKTQLMGKEVAEQATGCRGAGSYLEYAYAHGYPIVETLNWTSSAGDWQFLVSKDGNEWRILFQENNYPRPGFSHSIDERVWYGTLEEVVNDIMSEST